MNGLTGYCFKVARLNGNIKITLSLSMQHCMVEGNDTINIHFIDNKAKQPESSDLCGNMTEFGVAEGLPEPAVLS